MTHNPADLASRGLCAADIPSAGWLSGPKFLWEPEVLPTSKPCTELLVGDPEVKTVHVSAVQVSEHADILSQLERFSTWTTLIKVVIIKRLWSKLKYVDLVSVAERNRAAEEIFKLLQQKAFQSELKVLQRKPQGASLPKSTF